MPDREKDIEELRKLPQLPPQRFLYPCDHRVIMAPDGNPDAKTAICKAISVRSGHRRGVTTKNCAECQLETGEWSQKYVTAVGNQLSVQNLRRVRYGYYPPKEALRMFKLAYDNVGHTQQGRTTLRALMEECVRLNRFTEKIEELMEFVQTQMPELAKDEPIPEKVRSRIPRRAAHGRFNQFVPKKAYEETSSSTAGDQT